MLGQLDASGRNTRPRSMNHDRFACDELPDVKERVGGREIAGWEGRSVGQRHLFGHRVHVCGGHETLLGIATVDGAADDAKVAKQVAATRELRVVSHTRERRVDDDAIADSDAHDLTAYRRNDPGHIHPCDVWVLEARHLEPPIALDNIEAIERGGCDIDDDVARTRLRIRPIGELQHLRSARFGIEHRLHWITSFGVRLSVVHPRDRSMVRPTDHGPNPIVKNVTAATPSPADVARQYLSSFSSGDPATIATLVADDFVNEHTAGLGAGCVGRAVYQERLAGFLNDMQGLVYEVEQLIVDAESSEVAAFYVMSARWQGNAPFSIRGVQRLRIRDGRITHRTDYWDSAVFLAQVDENARSALEALGVVIANG